MPICFSNCLTIDFREHCGAKDWMTESGARRFSRIATKETADFFATARKDAEEFFGPIFGCLGAVLAFTVFVGLSLGALWLLVALVKFMWEHS